MTIPKQPRTLPAGYPSKGYRLFHVDGVWNIIHPSRKRQWYDNDNKVWQVVE